MLPVLPGAAGVIPASVVNHTILGYTYDTDPATPPGIVDLTVGGPPAANSIGQPGEVDLYRFTLASAGRYIIETEGPTNVLMSLFGPNSETTLITEDDDSGQGGNARIMSNLSAGAYFVRIRHFESTGTGTYGISVQPDAVQPTIPEIQVNGPPVQGDIQAANESDIYRFAATVTGLYTIETVGNTDTFLTLSGPNSETALIAQDDDSGPGANSSLTADLAAGIYFARVRHYSPTGTGGYSILVRR